MRKKFIVKNHRKKKIIFCIIFILLFSIGIGYSVISTNLSINGSIDISKYDDKTLYGVLRLETLNNGLAKEYTGSHHDSFIEEPSKKIYHWYAENSEDGTEVQNKNNVIFAEHCWQMIRTTDTGGVKMIYNGEAENNQCLNTRGTHVGYAPRTSQNLASNYWYGTDFIYDSSTKKFNVSGTTEQVTWNSTTGSGLVGKYTCKNTNVDDTCSTLYLVESYYNTSSAYVIPLNSSSNYSQFGKLQFNADTNSLSFAGYMHNTIYDSKRNYGDVFFPYGDATSISLSTNYWYADSVNWNSITGKYELVNPYQVSSSDDYPSLVGKYTFNKTISTHSQGSVYYIVTKVGMVSGTNSYYYISLSNGDKLSDKNKTYIYGDSYTDNGNSTYTINNPQSFQTLNYYNNYLKTINKYLCIGAVDNTCSDLWYVTSETNERSLSYIMSSKQWLFSSGFSYDVNTGEYSLNSDTINYWDELNIADKSIINNHHYTCWNENGVCNAISYIYYIDQDNLYYINIKDGKDINDAIEEMLYNNVNIINSTIKSGVDAWYKHNLLDYSDYLEDIIFCNDRSQINESLSGWNPNGGSIYQFLLFRSFDVTNDLSCTNITNQFSVRNNNARLNYKVGLLTIAEANLLNHVNARKSGQNFWTMSPRYYNSNYVSGRKVGAIGDIGSDNYVSSLGVRPMISLKTGLEYNSGDGSMANPYIVE